MPSGFHWPLPDSPTHPVYPNILRDIAATKNDRERRLRFRAICEADFWFFCRFASSFGDYVISDPSHWHHGKRWCDERWVFDRCRDIQRATDNRETGVFWNWSRYMFKTQLITILHTIWELLRNSLLTTAILTYKVDETGEAIFSGLRSELESNKRLHEHWPDVLTPAAIKLFTKTSLTVSRPLGPREPSVSLHSLDRLPTSMHVNRIKVDDAVVKETVRSQAMVQGTWDSMRKVTPLGTDDTLTWWIGTVWDRDDPYMIALREGFFVRRDHWSPWGRGPLWKGTPVLRSQHMLDDWRRGLGDYDFSAQMVGEPTARGEQTFLDAWLNESRYKTSPMQEAVGKKVYFILDPAGGHQGGDWTVLYIFGLGEDGKRYSLDLFRERFGLVETLELLFREVKKWHPEVVLVEEFGASSFVAAIKNEMEHRGYRFNVRKVQGGGLRRPKIDRIKLLQPVMQRLEVLWPEAGFGHGSKGDRRDTFDQFRSDEYRLWVPVEGAVLHDDMLDAVAWMVQPELKGVLQFPVDERAEAGYEPIFGYAGGYDNDISPWVL